MTLHVIVVCNSSRCIRLDFLNVCQRAASMYSVCNNLNSVMQHYLTIIGLGKARCGSHAHTTDHVCSYRCAKVTEMK